MDTVLTEGGGIAVSVLSEAVLAEGGWYTEAVRPFDDRLLVARGQAWRRPGEAEREGWVCSSTDGGATWRPYRAPGDGRDHARASLPFLLERRDGSVIGWGGAWNAAEVPPGRSGRPVAQTMIRARSWDALIAGAAEKAAAKVWIPYMEPLVGDDFRTLYTPALWGKMVETEAGHLIQGAYPVLGYGRRPRLWEEQKGPASQYRSCVIGSADDGETWHYLATVASPDRDPLPPQAEGYCEPDLLSFGEGRLLCVMRSGGNPTGRLMERYTPLVAAASVDGGLTWTRPCPIAPHGVKPVLLRMRSGLVACLSGRPGFFLILSDDDGKSWSTPHWVSESHGRWARSSSGYGELVETEPGVLGVAFDEYRGDGEDGKMVAVFRRYRIEPGS
jgi:hypothetical protein